MRRALSRTAVLLALLTVAACASGGKTKVASPDRAADAGGRESDAAITHFLNRVTFGARPQDIDVVRREGVQAFLDRQLHPERIDDSALDSRLASFETLNLSSKQIAEEYYQPAQEARRKRQAQAARGTPAAPGPQPASQTAEVGRAATGRLPQMTSAADQELFRKERLVLQELSNQKVLRAVYSERQLQEVLVDFWFNHFNVFAGKGADRGLLTAYERDIIRPHVFGKFRDLLGATAESPAMLFFLDNWLSAAPNDAVALRTRRALLTRPALVRAPSQQKKPARGLNENYARELMELHTLGVDGGYTQRDVVEVARCFTGWTIAQPRDGGGFRFADRQHDPGQKVVLGHVIKAGGGKEDGERVLDILARDPHTARFISTKLIRRFVSDDPPASLVDRVAKRFRETDGDLREVSRAILLSPEFRSAQAYSAKVKTPLEFVASALRATAATIADATATTQAIRMLGMPLYFCQPPTGYADRADAWVTSGALLGRMNFALALMDGRLAGVRVDPAALDGSPSAIAARLGGPEFQKK